MSSNNKLYRNFIILQEDERGFSNAEDKTLSGYSKIEARGDKCKVSYYAQNLRSEDCKYYMVLICNKKDTKKIINLGELRVSSDGKGEATKEYLSDSIGNLNISYDRVCGSAIMSVKEGIPVYILCGFLNGQVPSDNWRNYQIIKAESKIEKDDAKLSKKASKNERKEAAKAEAKIVKESRESTSEENIEKDVEVDNKVIDVDTTDNGVDDIKNQVDETAYRDEIDEILEVNEKDDITKEELEKPLKTRSIFDDYEKSIEDLKSVEDEYELRGNSGSFFNSLVRGFDKNSNKIHDIKNCKWYKINVKDLYQMCNTSDYNKYTIVYYPMINYYPYIKKHEHFLLGLKGDKDGNMKYIVYGVPGDKDLNDQPYEGRTGFVTWVKDDDDNGYWLMFYDFKNSTVVIPME